MADELTAELERIAELVTKRDEALAWVARATADGGELDAATGAFDAAQDKLAARAPRLLAAITAVLELTGELEHLRTAPPSGDLDEAAVRGINWTAAKVREAITQTLAGNPGVQEAQRGEGADRD